MEDERWRDLAAKNEHSKKSSISVGRFLATKVKHGPSAIASFAINTSYAHARVGGKGLP